jgi:hypothetical protein
LGLIKKLGSQAVDIIPEKGASGLQRWLHGTPSATPLAVLNNIATMGKSTVSFHIPETKQQSKQWLRRAS